MSVTRATKWPLLASISPGGEDGVEVVLVYNVPRDKQLRLPRSIQGLCKTSLLLLGGP